MAFYSDKEWMINDEPVHNWRKLADKWEDNEFVDMPDVFYTHDGIDVYNSLPQDLKAKIESDHAASGGNRVQKRTLKKIEKAIKKSK